MDILFDQENYITRDNIKEWKFIPNFALEMIQMDKMIEKLIYILKKHGVKKIEIFGSYARGEANAESDLDVIVEFEERKSLFEPVGIEQQLEDYLG